MQVALPLFGLVVVLSGPCALARAFWPSPRRPAAFLRRPRPRGPVVACLGASNTQANIAWDWVASLEASWGPRGWAS